jgi:hypothetical protein
MKVQNIKKAIARIFKNIRWFMLVDHGESVDTVGQMLDRIDQLVLNHEDEIDELKMKIEELAQQLEAVDELVDEKLNDYDFDHLMSEAISEHDFSYEIGEAVADHDFDDAIREEVAEFDFDDKIGEALEAFDFDDKIESSLESVSYQIDQRIAAKFSTARIVFGDVEEPKQTEALLDEVAVHPFVDPAIDAIINFDDSE